MPDVKSKTRFLLHGANGYTGRLATELAAEKSSMSSFLVATKTC
jgi:short subunit dehydrogenase-like uncharacterized protein